MLRSTLVLSLAVLLGVCVTVACSESDGGATSTDFGCCPAVKSTCSSISFNGSRKRSATDDCHAGNDGTIPDPDQPGWTLVTNSAGCEQYVPPKNPIMIQCGLVPRPDAGPDADASDASDAADAADDASDASSD